MFIDVHNNDDKMQVTTTDQICVEELSSGGNSSQSGLPVTNKGSLKF